MAAEARVSPALVDKNLRKQVRFVGLTWPSVGIDHRFCVAVRLVCAMRIPLMASGTTPVEARTADGPALKYRQPRL
jgi:hypothetical protein